MKIKLSVLSLFIGLSSVLLAQEKLISLRPTLNSDDTKSCPFSQRDTRVREYVTPVRMVWQQHTEFMTGTDFLFRQGNGQPDLVNANICILRSQNGVKPSILLDFGKEIQGGIQVVTGMPASKKPITVRIRFGESVSEAMCEIDGKNGASNDHAIRDFEMKLPWLGVAEFGNSGFRFARIDLIDDNVELHIKEIRAISVYRDIPYKGSFCSNDERLNKIWQTGAYTVHLNMQEFLWDGIKRDRLVWVGDMHPEVMTISSVFGYNEVVPKSLNAIRDVTPLPNWMNGISSYSIWWLLIQRDWFYYQGDRNYLNSQKDYIVGLIRFLMNFVDEKGGEKLDGMRFLDWPSSNSPESIHAGLQALLVMAMDASYELCNILGETELANEAERLAKKMRKAAPAVRKQYLKSMKDPSAPGAKQGAALMVLANLMDAKEADQHIISVNGAHGFSTFYGYYMLKAMAKAGDYKGALDIIRTYWGAMLDLGATTFWEDFDLNWLPNAARIDEIVPEGKNDIHRDFGAYCYQKFRHSFCHGWASGPTSWLSEYVLGVQVVEPGCKVIRIVPHLGDLKWVKGTFPTPYGIISISHTLSDNGKIVTEVDAPSEVLVLRE